MKKVNIRPTTSVYATYKNINYQIWTAIAEFVDNSTQSYLSNKRSLQATKYWNGLRVEVNYLQDSEGNYYLEIRDNAYGMNFVDFQRAIILDSKPSFATRSEFGMGLKTAACWFGLKWSVESTQLGNSVKYKAEVDVEQLSKYKNEEIEVLELDCNPKEHGTIIRIYKMNRTIKGRQVAKTKAMLAGMYREDIRSGDIQISYNDEILEFHEPEVYIEELKDKTKIIWKKNICFEIEFNNCVFHVNGFVAIRKKASTTESGFTLIRRGRVIIGGYENNYRPKEIFGNSNSFVYQRLFGELNMDDWPVVQTKDNFDWNNGLEDEFINRLIEMTTEYVYKARTIRVRKKTNVEETINQTIKSFESKGIISNIEVSDYCEENNSVLDIDNDFQELCDENNDEVFLENNIAKSITFKTINDQYKFNMIIEINNEDEEWLKIRYNESNEYNIIWNISHPFFKKYMNDPNFVLSMQKFIFAFAISEVESKKHGINNMIDPSNIRKSMNSILKQIGKEE